MGKFCYKLYINKFDFKTYICWDFPGHPVVKNLCFHCKGIGSISGQGTKIPHAAWCSQKNKNMHMLLLIFQINRLEKENRKTTT